MQEKSGAHRKLGCQGEDQTDHSHFTGVTQVPSHFLGVTGYYLESLTESETQVLKGASSPL